MFHVHNEKKEKQQRSSSSAASAAKPSSPPSGNKPTRLSDARACYCVSQRSINRKIPCTGGEVGRRMETMAVPNIEGDGESCKKNPAQKAG
jgi:hypothetical protein